MKRSTFSGKKGFPISPTVGNIVGPRGGEGGTDRILERILAFVNFLRGGYFRFRSQEEW